MRCINLGNNAYTNYILCFPQGHILVDAGNRTTYKQFLARLAKADIAVGDIRYVVLTHTHDDHISYLQDLLNANPDITLLCHSLAIPRLADDHMVIGHCTSRLIRNTSNLMDKLHLYAPYPTTVPARYVTVEDKPDYLVQEGYPCRFTVLLGHTMESIGLLVEDRDYFVGDAMFNMAPAKHLIPLVMEDVEAYRDSFRSICNSGATTLYFGHGKPCSIAKAQACLPYLDGIKLYDK